MTGFKKIEKKQKNRIVATTIALIILAILFLAGPAAAFTVTWDVSDETPNTGDTITIEAEVVKETTEVYTDDIRFKITKPDGTTTLLEGVCSPEVSDFAGYSYGTYGYGVLGYNYGYQSGYGYGLTHATTITCSTNYIVDGQEGNYTIELVNVSNDTEYVMGESKQITATTATTSTSGTPTTTTPGTTPTTEPETTTETVYEATETVTYTPEQLEEVLNNMTDDQGNALFTEEEIAKMIENAEEYEFEITVKVDKITDAEGNVSYKTTITTTITNNTGKDQKNVKVIVEVPKEVTPSAANINSGTLFTKLKDDPILEFTLPLVKAGQSYNIEYTVTDTTQPELEGVSFNEPAVRFAEEVEDEMVCPTVWEPVCGVDGTTYSNECYAEIAGVAIAYEGECVPTPPLTEETNYTTLWILIAIIILVIIGIAYYKREDIQKRIKK